ncbi:MAG: hypothetical protein ACYTEL_20550 [Planctomycetota bacterium]|jgi:hypothetical protein
MDPTEASKRISAAAHKPSEFNPIIYIKSAWKEITAVSAFVGVSAGALAALRIITPDIQGVLIIVTITVAAAIAVSILIHRSFKRDLCRVVPTLHLDRDPAQHTIDLHFKNFLPTGDISILQTWIPESGYVVEERCCPPRIQRWQRYLQDSIVRNYRISKNPIHLSVLLLGSEDVLRNRIRYRWDLAGKYKSYPFCDDELEMAVDEAKKRIDSIHNALLELEKGVGKYLADNEIPTTFQVDIRYYRVTPYGPIYIFGDQALLTGFYDPRWTSDRAPAVRLDNPNSAEWIYFSTLFENIWSLKHTHTSERIPPDDETTIYTTHAPAWRTGLHVED